MIEKGRISALQLAVIIFPLIIGTADLIMPAIIAKAAQTDLWIPPIIASLNGFLMMFVIYQLNKSYPRKTIIQYSIHILGKFPGNLLGFLIYCFIFTFQH